MTGAKRDRETVSVRAPVVFGMPNMPAWGRQHAIVICVRAAQGG